MAGEPRAGEAERQGTGAGRWRAGAVGQASDVLKEPDLTGRSHRRGAATDRESDNRVLRPWFGANGSGMVSHIRNFSVTPVAVTRERPGRRLPYLHATPAILTETQQREAHPHTARSTPPARNAHFGPVGSHRRCRSRSSLARRFPHPPSRPRARCRARDHAGSAPRHCTRVHPGSAGELAEREHRQDVRRSRTRTADARSAHVRPLTPSGSACTATRSVATPRGRANSRPNRTLADRGRTQHASRPREHRHPGPAAIGAVDTGGFPWTKAYRPVTCLT